MMSNLDKDRNSSEIGHRIKLLRRSAGLSQANLGSTLGVTFQQIQKYESGQSKIAAEKLQRIAQALGVDVGYFYDDRPETSFSIKLAEPNKDSNSAEQALFKGYFDKIQDPRARYLLAELARVFYEIESSK